MTSRLLYPDSLLGRLPTAPLSDSLLRVYNFGTAIEMGHRIPLLFDAPVRLLVRVQSVIGDQRNWVRAGQLAQILHGLPGEPKKAVKRLYLDDGFFELDGAGYPFYLEFWAYRWLTDYYLEVWAQLAPGVVVIEAQPFTIDGEVFTIDGVQLVL